MERFVEIQSSMSTPKQRQQQARISQYEDVLIKARRLTTTFAPSVKYRPRDIPIPHPISVKHVPNLRVVNHKLIESILSLPFGTSPPLVLNLASHHHFGGGVERGAFTQEAELFRTTDYGCHRGREFYPLMKDEFVVTPSVTVLKNDKGEDLPIEQIRRVDMIAIPAVRLPDGQDTFTSKELQIATAKIETLFYYAAAHGYRHLVLGDLGCDVLCRNPPEVVARIFGRTITKFGHHFDLIVFSMFTGGTFAIFHRMLLGRDPPVAAAPKKKEDEITDTEITL